MAEAVGRCGAADPMISEKRRVSETASDWEGFAADVYLRVMKSGAVQMTNLLRAGR